MRCSCSNCYCYMKMLLLSLQDKTVQLLKSNRSIPCSALLGFDHSPIQGDVPFNVEFIDILYDRTRGVDVSPHSLLCWFTCNAKIVEQNIWDTNGEISTISLFPDSYQFHWASPKVAPLLVRYTFLQKLLFALPMCGMERKPERKRLMLLPSRYNSCR